MKKILLLLVFALGGFSAYCQYQVPVDTVTVAQQAVAEKQPSKFNAQRLYFGGYLGASFGRVTSISVAPLVGYKLTEKFSVGTQISYEYFNDRHYDFDSSNYGFSVFTRYRIVPQLYAHVEYEMMNYELYSAFGKSDREWVPFLFVGGGFSQQISRNMWMNAQLLFDVIQDKDSPYRDWEPFYSIGFGVGF